MTEKVVYISRICCFLDFIISSVPTEYGLELPIQKLSDISAALRYCTTSAILRVALPYDFSQICIQMYFSKVW